MALGGSQAGDYQTITYEAHGRLAIVSLNRPKTRNAISRVMTYELDRAFKAACLDESVRVIVLRANGDHFSSGHDLGSDEHLQSLEKRPYEQGPRGDFEKWSELDVEMCLSWRQLRKPVVCGVQGFCIYHATCLASVADIVFAADDLKYMPTLSEFFTLPWDLALHARRVKDILFTQRFVLAPEALFLGLANRVVPREQLDEELLRYANLVAASDSFQLRMFKTATQAAQDAAGYTAHTRSTLAHWSTYRWDWAEHAGKDALTKDHGGAEKRLAPVKRALRPEFFALSEAAARDAQRLEAQSSKL